jgi:MFS family permease
VLGGIVVGRLLSPGRRNRVLRPLALLSALALVPLAFPMPLWAVLLFYMASGFGMSFLLPLNAMFVRVLPTSFRGRAFGVVQSGLQVSQGLAVVLAGWAATHVDTRHVIGAAGLFGVVVVGVLAAMWPSGRDSNRVAAEPV